MKNKRGEVYFAVIVGVFISAFEINISSCHLNCVLLCFSTILFLHYYEEPLNTFCIYLRGWALFCELRKNLNNLTFFFLCRFKHKEAYEIYGTFVHSIENNSEDRRKKQPKSTKIRRNLWNDHRMHFGNGQSTSRFLYTLFHHIDRINILDLNSYVTSTTLFNWIVPISFEMQ